MSSLGRGEALQILNTLEQIRRLLVSIWYLQCAAFGLVVALLVGGAL